MQLPRLRVKPFDRSLTERNHISVTSFEWVPQWRLPVAFFHVSLVCFHSQQRPPGLKDEGRCPGLTIPHCAPMQPSRNMSVRRSGSPLINYDSSISVCSCLLPNLTTCSDGTPPTSLVHCPSSRKRRLSVSQVCSEDHMTQGIQKCLSKCKMLCESRMSFYHAVSMSGRSTC